MYSQGSPRTMTLPLTCGDCAHFDHDAEERENYVATAEWRDRTRFRCRLGALVGADEKPCPWGRKEN